MTVDPVPNRGHIAPPLLVVIAALGAALGTGWDMLHVHFGATEYAIGPGLQPGWVPIEFAIVYLVGVLSIVRLGRPRPGGRSLQQLAAEGLWVSAVYTITAVAHEREWLVFVILVPALAARSGSLRGIARENAVPAVALVAGGPAIEAVLIAAGVFRYDHATLGNVPVWLPLLYASAVPFAIRLTEAALQLSPRLRRRAA